MAHDVFVSYSSQDKPIADAVCASLEAKKIRCWIAPRDVLAGIPYGEALAEALPASRVLVLVLSARANESPHIMREVESAVDKGIPIVPFRIENVLPSKSLDYFLKAIHWLDAITPPVEAHLDKLADTVHSLLARNTGEAMNASGTIPPLPPRPPQPSASKRWLLALIGVGLVLAIGAATMIPWLSSPHNGEKERQKFESGPESTFLINFYRPSGKGDDLIELGDLGQPGMIVAQEDRFEVQSTCGPQLHAHVLAINPDGSIQLLFADAKIARPSGKLRAPLQSNTFYTLDDAGTQGVLLVVSEQPLPEFDGWRPKLSAAAWKELSLSMPWKWDGQGVAPMDKKRVGIATYGPEALATVCRQIQAVPTVVAVQAVVFKVQAKIPEGAEK